MTHLEKILSYCKLAPNIEPSWKRQKSFEKKYAILMDYAPIHLLFIPFLIVFGVSFLGNLGLHQMVLMWIAGVCVSTAALFGWEVFKRRQTRRKLGYSFGIMEDAPNEKQTHAILEKLLRLPTNPQTQDLKSQLWALADKNLLPNRWWTDVEKEIDEWIVSHERDALKSKLLDTENLEAVNVKQEDEIQTSTTASPQRVVV